MNHVQNFQCNICFITSNDENMSFENFQIISCGHILCQKCLTQYFNYQQRSGSQQDKFVCPTCKTPIQTNKKVPIPAHEPLKKKSFDQKSNWCVKGPSEIIMHELGE